MNSTTSRGGSTKTVASTPKSNSAAVDADPAMRPGIPMEMDPPRPAGAAHWNVPERQRDPGNILKRKGLEALTPVFGVTVAPRGLSGMMRKAAYKIPEHYTSHWLMLLLADRVDAIESRPMTLAVPLVAGAAALLVMKAMGSQRKRRWW